MEETKLLGTIITNDLKWDITFVRSLLEQSSTVWHSSLSQQNKIDLESEQKIAHKIILKDEFISYEHSLNILEILE